MDTEQNDGWFASMWRVVEWTKTTLMVVGFLASVTFLRVNFFGADVSLSFPEYVSPGIRASIEQERQAQVWEAEREAEMARKVMRKGAK
jgi:uncharacterized protein (DUF2237 family)